MIKLSAVTSGRFKPLESKRLPTDTPPRPRLEIREGDVLMSRANGVQALVGVPSVVGPTRDLLLLSDLVFRLLPVRAMLDSRYLALVLACLSVRRQIDSVMRGSSGQFKISQADIRKLRVPLYTLDEQHLIVDAVNSVDRDIEALERRIVKLTVVRDTAIEDVLSRVSSVDHCPVRTVGSVRMGKQLSPSSVSYGEQFPYLRVANVLADRIDTSDVKAMHFTERERAMFQLMPGDVLLNEGQSIELVGRSAIFRDSDQPMYFQNTLIRFRPDADVLSEYAQVIFTRWLRDGEFAKIAKQTTSIAHLGADRFAGMMFPHCSLADQETVSRTACQFKAQLAVLEDRAAKLRTMRQALAEDLLTGRVRVTDL
ncbi:restriction endonuclease subunit S [Streptomyces sp. SHP 1-2]|uniref:restriction endonuclease subunit S n=1 Tax=Streptomyces sp. SHP 1-2 TaxID=2769489 RepID=UPI002236F878|nr:restriction endonuclease subunit S [Streptomyces sp. SHP 1-2]MCW5250518.1 restriction endonuclease subunit S [Streptomyces sp. SHP 1-2]